MLEGGLGDFLALDHRERWEFAGRSENDDPICAINLQIGEHVFVQFFIEFKVFVAGRRSGDPEQYFSIGNGWNIRSARLGSQRFRNFCATGSLQRGGRPNGTQKSSSRGWHDSLLGRKPAKV